MTQEDRLRIAQTIAAQYLDMLPYLEARAVAKTLLDLVTERQEPLPEESDIE